jgi:hypothetical protein
MSCENGQNEVIKLAKAPIHDYLSSVQFIFKKPILFNPKILPMKQEFDLRPIPAGKLLLRLALLGIVLLGCVYGFLVLFNSALGAMK